MGGAFGGANSYFKGENVWNGSNIAPGRNAFSLKNTPIEALERNNPNAYLPAEQPNVALLDSPTPLVPENSNTLIHYTTEQGYNNIMESEQLLPSMGEVHARFGNGQYLTDLNSMDYTSFQISRRLYGVPWNTRSLTNYIKIDITGLNVIKNAPYNYLIPNNQPLNIKNRIVGGGVTVFKIKF